MPINMPHYRDRHLVFYDIEVFQYDWAIVFKDEDKTVRRIYHFGPNDSTRPDVIEVRYNPIHYTEEILNLIKQATLVSYNGYHYDDKILSSIIGHSGDSYAVKLDNDKIMRDMNVTCKFGAWNVWTIDISREIAGRTFHAATGKSYPPPLKKIEAQMGMDIVETEIDFDIDRPLTSEEIDSTIFYCEHDVDALIEIFKLEEQSYLIPKQVLLERLRDVSPNPDKFDYRYWLTMNVTTIMGTMLMGFKKDDKNDSWENFLVYSAREYGHEKAYDKTVEFLAEQVENGFPQQVVDMWLAAYYDDELFKMVKPKPKTVVTRNGVKYEFGFGGLHGKPARGQSRYSSMFMLDVRSLYPNIMINLDTLGEATPVFAGIVDERAKVKHTNKLLSDGLKLGINKVYGCLGSRFSKLYNKFGTLSVCAYGQILLFDLCQRLEKLNGLKLININTDGVGFTYDGDKADWQKIWKEWETEWNLVLEEDYFSEVFQKDVNNYVGVVDGKAAKVKGGMVGRYKKPEYFKEGSLRILDICIVEALVNKQHPMKTIRQHRKEPMKFMQTCYCSRNYDHVENERGETLPQKVNRVFAVRQDFKEAEGIWRVKADGTKAVFPNVPKSLIIYNSDISGFTDFEQMIDINYYVELALAKLKMWGISEDELEVY